MADRGARWGIAWLGLLTSWVMAATPVSEAALDEHVNRLASELRCLVCQNQTVADSQAELAVQLKQEVRRQLSQGATDDQVRAFMVARYGDFVLYRPPVSPSTALLWAGPALLLLFGVGVLAWHWRERRLASPGVEGADDAPDADGSAWPVAAEDRP